MRIQAKCSAMQIQERFAAVDHIHELSLHYSGHKPIKRCTPSPRQWQEAADQEGSSPVGEGSTQEESCWNRQAQGGRKRKRRKKDYEPNEKEALARTRHAEIEPALQAALADFQAWLRSTGCSTLSLALGSPACRSGQSRRPQQSVEPAAVNSLDVGSQKDASQVRNPRKNLQGLESASSEREEAGLPEQTGEHDSREVLELGSGSFERPDPADGSLDLLALAKLAHIIKPKFAFRGQHRAGNLFNRCIRNESAEDRKCTAHETEVVVPGGCRFLMSDLSKFRLLLEEPNMAHGFDCIVIDPPWENKSVKRGSTYPTILSRQLLNLPVPQLLKQGGGLVLVWLTNRQKLHTFVHEELLPAWDLHKLCTWYWLKVTERGDPIGHLGSEHHKPYEPILLAASRDFVPEHPLTKEYCIFSVPEEHSRKPHLGRLLQRHLPAGPSCLELFARELAKGWTSAGNQVLHFQQVVNFEALG